MTSAEVKNAWSYTSTPHYALQGGAQLKHKTDLPFNFTFIFYVIFWEELTF
jgi:hypothetical protein